MSVVFIVFARDEKILPTNPLNYLGCIETFSGKHFEMGFKYREIELSRGEGCLFIVNDVEHTCNDLHVIMYDADNNDMLQYADWMQGCLTEVFTHLRVGDVDSIEHYVMNRTDTTDHVAIVYRIPFDKKDYLGKVAMNARKELKLVKD
jgi:hypothetical protein